MNLIKYSAHSLNLSHYTWFYSLTKSDILQAYFFDFWPLNFGPELYPNRRLCLHPLHDMKIIHKENDSFYNT